MNIPLQNHQYFFLCYLISAIVFLFASCRETVDSGPTDPQDDKTPVMPDTAAIDALQIQAEKYDFKRTSNYEQTLDFLRHLDPLFPSMRLTFFGTSAEGREMPLVIVSKERAFTPEKARKLGKPIVLIQNGIHAGEIDGKDACLMMLKNLALGNNCEILDTVTLLIIPILNVDGHERISPNNRPNQNGPLDGMGFRTTTSGLDLNRDHLKLVSPEARAVVALFNAWRPHLHVDNHVTDGCDHDWVLTYTWPESPQVALPIDEWLTQHMPTVIEETQKRGHRAGPYVELKDRGDPTKGFSGLLLTPRYSSSYYALRNRPAILIEMHSYKPYRARVLANRDFLYALLEEVSRSPQSLMRAVELAEQSTVNAGRAGAPPSEVTISFKESTESDEVLFPIYDWQVENSIVTGKPMLFFKRGKVREIRVPRYHKVVVDQVLSRPRGYLVMPGWPAIERRLKDHGLRVEMLAEPAELDVETIRLSQPRLEPKTYQGETRMEVQVSRQQERRSFPLGALWIPADQPDFQVAVQLIEPEAPDSLVRWGLLGGVLERKTYIGSIVLENYARELNKNKEIAEDWKQALTQETFVQDREARYLWWYKKTKHWDEQVGLLPAMRVLTPLEVPTKPWSREEIR